MYGNVETRIDGLNNYRAGKIRAQKAVLPGPPSCSHARRWGFAMLMGDFLTVAQYELPIKNHAVQQQHAGNGKVEMMTAGLPDFGTDFKHFDFAKIAEARGIVGIRIGEPRNLRAALHKCFAHPGPVLLDVVTNPHKIFIPAKITGKQVMGFSLFLLKETLGGNMDEVEELITRALGPASVRGLGKTR
jgi:pyruvate dehydrogenase (quinone)